jgi:hypothetical protein
MHYPHYIKSRRDCWGAAAVHAPLDVKRAIWEHEKDELIFDKRMGSAHLTDEQMAAAAAEATLLPGVRAAGAAPASPVRPKSPRSDLGAEPHAQSAGAAGEVGPAWRLPVKQRLNTREPQSR